MKRYGLVSIMILISVLFFHTSCKKVPFFAAEGATLVLSSDKNYVKTGEEARIVIMGFSATGEPLHDHTSVVIFASMGSITPSEIELMSGKALVVFKSDRSGISQITARSGNIVSEALEIKVGNAALESLSISSNPSEFPYGGGTSKISVFAFDENGNLLSDIPIVLSSTSGYFKKGGIIYTNENGVAEDYLTITDSATVKAVSGGKEATVEIKVKEEEKNEKPTADFSYSPQSPYMGEDIYFNGTLSKDGDGYIVSYEWDFGDGSTGRGERITHQYDWPGSETSKTFNVILTVRDDKGAEGVSTKTITITKR